MTSFSRELSKALSTVVPTTVERLVSFDGLPTFRQAAVIIPAQSQSLSRIPSTFFRDSSSMRSATNGCSTPLPFSWSGVDPKPGLSGSALRAHLKALQNSNSETSLVSKKEAVPHYAEESYSPLSSSILNRIYQIHKWSLPSFWGQRGARQICGDLEPSLEDSNVPLRMD